MGLLDKINTCNEAATQAELEQMTEQQARRDEIKEARARIVFEGMTKFATDQGCEMVELTRIGADRYFLVGDLVFMVRAERLLDRSKAEMLTPKEVLWQHITYLVGFDLTERIELLRIGVLCLLSFDGVLKTHNVGAGRFEFDNTTVVSLLYPMSED